MEFACERDFSKFPFADLNLTMPILSPDTPFHFVHVGKCGGSSIASELRGAGFRFEHFHLQRPVVHPENRYLILARDPVARFVSAFHWRKHLYLKDAPPSANSKGPVSELRHRAEREFLSQFETANALAEQLGTDGPTEVSPASSLLALIGHVPQGFDWYLGHLIDQIEPWQVAGVICTENLSGDFEHLFGFLPEKEINRLNSSTSTQISAKGRANLAGEFHREYAVLNKLSLVAQKAGVRMSMRYDPVFGAMPAT